MSDSPLEHAARVLLSLAAVLGASAVLCLVVVRVLLPPHEPDSHRE